MSLSVKGFEYSSSDSNISVTNDSVLGAGQPAVDAYEVVSPTEVSGPPLSGLPPVQIDIVLVDTDATVFSDDSLPLTLNLGDFEIVSEEPAGTTGGRLIFQSSESGQMGEIRFEITELSFAEDTSPGTESKLLFPEFADGLFGDPAQNNSTRIILRNNDNSEVSGRVRFRNPSGQLTPVSVGGQLTDTVDFNIAGFGVLDVETDGTGAFQVGSAEVLIDSGDGSDLEGTLIFSVLGNFVSVDAAPLRSAQQTFVSINSTENTGVAILNSDTETASMLELTLVRNGQAQATAQLEVPQGRQIVGFVDEDSFFKAFFDANPGDFTGTLNIHVLTGPAVAVMGLMQKRSSGALIAVSTSDKAFEQVSASSVPSPLRQGREGAKTHLRSLKASRFIPEDFMVRSKNRRRASHNAALLNHFVAAPRRCVRLS